VTERFDRILGVLLFLRSGQSVPATELARRFAVSTRTIHRDLKTLEAVGVPVYAERGRAGGFRLVEGYFLPPLMFAPGEAIALLLGLTLLRRLRAKPFPADLDTVARKLLAAVPAPTRAALERAEALIGFEPLPDDIFHPELDPCPSATPSGAEPAEARESATIGAFLQAILDGDRVWTCSRTGSVFGKIFFGTNTRRKKNRSFIRGGSVLFTRSIADATLRF